MYAEGTEITLKAPEHVGIFPVEGKIFDYWQIGNPEISRKNIDETITITSETYIYAIWKDAPISEVNYFYYPGEATGNADCDTVDIGTEITLKECAFIAPEGKQFKAWAIGSLSGEQKQPGEQITITGETYIYAIWEDVEVIVPHTCTPSLVPKEEPECGKSGKSAYYHCECGKNYEDAQGNTEITDLDSWGNLAPLEHIAGDWIVDTEATETVPGSKHKECSLCGITVETETIPATGKKEENTQPEENKKPESQVPSPEENKKPEENTQPQSPVPALKGTVITDEQGTGYKVTKSDAKDGEVAYVKPKAGISGAVIIPDTVTIDSITYKVTAIEPKAFAGNKKIKSFTIGANITKIGAKAFFGCSKLKTLTIKSTKLSTKKVGSKAFAKTPKKMTVKVPKKKFKAYKSMLIKRGVNKKAKFKKSS